MTFHEKTILQICTANFIISEMNRQVPPILLKAELSVMLFRKFLALLLLVKVTVRLSWIAPQGWRLHLIAKICLTCSKKNKDSLKDSMKFRDSWISVKAFS